MKVAICVTLLQVLMGDDLNDGKWHNFVLDQRGSAVTIRLDNRKQSHGMTTGGTGEVVRGVGWHGWTEVMAQ